MTYTESVEDVATSIKSELFAWITVEFDPADLHVAGSDHFKLIVPSKQHNNNNNNNIYSPMCRIENNKKEKKLVVKKHNDRLPEKQKCSFKLATHSLLSVIIIDN